MEFYPLLMLFFVLCAIVGGAVYGTRELMVAIHVPEPYVWVIPLIVFFVLVALVVRYIWREVL